MAVALLVAVVLVGPASGAAADVTRPLAAQAVAGAALARASSGAVVPLAARSPFEAEDETEDAAEAAVDPPALSGRLARAAETLRRSPLAVDPELTWMFDRATRRRLERTLDRSPVPVLVAVLPQLDEDESGGDGERILQTLQREVGTSAVYVVVDQRGRFALASVGVARDLQIPYGLMSPPDDGRPSAEQEREPAPPGWKSVPGRLSEVVARVAEAGPGTANAVIDDVDPLEPVFTDYRAERNREDAVAAAVTGALLGLVLGGVLIGVRAGIRSVRTAGARRR